MNGFPICTGGNENLEAIELIKHLNSILKKRDPGVLSIAEESTAFPLITGSLEEGGLGFDLKWNMGFMNDYLVISNTIRTLEATITENLPSA